MNIALFGLLQGTASQAAQSASDIRDIRGPIALAEPPAFYGMLAAALLVIAVCVGVGWLMKRRRKPAPNPYQQARARIAHAESYMETVPSATSASWVLEAVRHCVSTRYELEGAHLTADEFLLLVLERDEQRQLLADHRSRLALLLKLCEQTKFSGSPLARPAVRELCASALDLVNHIEKQARQVAP